jgi:hypothetical protein
MQFKFLKKYKYNFLNLISLKVIIFTWFFYILFHIIWKDYSYNFSNIWFLFSIILILFIYLIIIFKEIAILKNEQISTDTFYKLIEKDYAELLKKIKSNEKETNIYSYIFINKIAETWFSKYKKNLPFIEKTQYSCALDTPKIILKDYIIKLKDERIPAFKKREKYNLALIFAYIFKKIIWDKNENIQSIRSQNNEKIRELENKIQVEKGYFYMKSLKKDSNAIYNDFIKKITCSSWFKIEELLDNELKEKFVTFIFYKVALSKYTQKEKSLIYSFFNFINPIPYITWKIFK